MLFFTTQLYLLHCSHNIYLLFCIIFLTISVHPVVPWCTIILLVYRNYTGRYSRAYNVSTPINVYGCK